MNAHIRTIIGLTALVVAAPVAAQEGTDFSGRWILESGARDSEAPTALTVHQSVARTNLRGEPMKPFYNEITIVREFITGRRSVTYPIGGVEGTVPGGIVGGGKSQEPCTELAVRWEGKALVFETSTHTGPSREKGDWSERQERWSVDSQGKLHTVIGTSSSAEGSRQIALVYRRQ